MAGVSIGCELSASATVCLLERESRLAFHTTGRSAATYVETNGNVTIRHLTIASRGFLASPPDFVRSELLKPRPVVYFASAAESGTVLHLHENVANEVRSVELLDERQAHELFPFFRPGAVHRALLEPDAHEIDVDSLHQGYARGLRANGGSIVRSAAVVEIARSQERWIVRTADGKTRTASILVNAAGAWADEVAAMAGCRPLALRPLRRTVFMTGAPDGADTTRLPMVVDASGRFYVKPDGGQLLCSPADETPSPAVDAKADHLAIAKAVDDINAATSLSVRSVRTSWAGLRTFAPDDVPVVGPDKEVPDFHWFAGQGGYGIQIAPTIAAIGAKLILCSGADDLSASFRRYAEDLAPARLAP